MDDSDKRESDAAEQAPPKIKAEDNPWYLLATAYGEPSGEPRKYRDKELRARKSRDKELREKNRRAWNRYFAANLDDINRARLINENGYKEEELTRFSQDELQELKKAICKYRGSIWILDLPKTDGSINFSNVLFDRYVDFRGYLFINSLFTALGRPYSTLFRHAIFSHGANFQNAIFFGDARFESSALQREAKFRNAIFFHSANFQGATFSDKSASDKSANFSSATFSGEVNFTGAVFSTGANFSRAIFKASSSFVNAKIKHETSFESAIFETEPPGFFGAKLHQGTVWRGIPWPKPKNKDEAARFIDAYACLKLEGDRLKKHEDELKFFALELQSRRVRRGDWNKLESLKLLNRTISLPLRVLGKEISLYRPAEGLPIMIYGGLSDYGLSYIRPLNWLFVTALLPAPAFWLFGNFCILKSLGLSFANTLNVFGFRKDFLPGSFNSLPWGLDFLAAGQTILGTILLFLTGLGIRNHFRMK